MGQLTKTNTEIVDLRSMGHICKFNYFGLFATHSFTNSTSNSIFWSFSSTNLTTYGRPSSIFCWISESDKFLQCPSYLFGTRFLADSFRNNASLFSVQKQGYANPPLKVEKILEGSLDLISSPSPSVKIQIMGGNVCLRFKGKTLLGIVKKLLKTKSKLSRQ